MGPKPVNWWFVTCWPNYNIQYGKAIGLYRDDGLGIFKESPRETENIKKDVCKLFQENGFKITVEANKKVINFLETTLDHRPTQTLH